MIDRPGFWAWLSNLSIGCEVIQFVDVGILADKYCAAMVNFCANDVFVVWANKKLIHIIPFVDENERGLFEFFRASFR